MKKTPTPSRNPQEEQSRRDHFDNDSIFKDLTTHPLFQQLFTSFEPTAQRQVDDILKHYIPISEQIHKLLGLNLEPMKSKEELIALMFSTGRKHYANKRLKKTESEKRQKFKISTIKKDLRAIKLPQNDFDAEVRLNELEEKISKYFEDIHKSPEICCQILYLFGLLLKEQTEEVKARLRDNHYENIEHIVNSLLCGDKLQFCSLQQLSNALLGLAHAGYNHYTPFIHSFILHALPEAKDKLNYYFNEEENSQNNNEISASLHQIFWALEKLEYSQDDQKIDHFVKDNLALISRHIHKIETNALSSFTYSLAKLNYTAQDKQINDFLSQIATLPDLKNCTPQSVAIFCWSFAVMQAPKEQFLLLKNHWNFCAYDFSNYDIIQIYQAHLKYGLEIPLPILKKYQMINPEKYRPKENNFEKKVSRDITRLPLPIDKITKQHFIHGYFLDNEILLDGYKIDLESDGDFFHLRNGHRKTKHIMRDQILSDDGYIIIRFSDSEYQNQGPKVIEEKIETELEAMKKGPYDLNIVLIEVLKEYLHIKQKDGN